MEPLDTWAQRRGTRGLALLKSTNEGVEVSGMACANHSRDEHAQHSRSLEHGFTLIELMVSMVLVGLLMSLATGGWLSYRKSIEHRGSAQELVSALRNAQQASIAEAVTYCVKIDAVTRSYRLYKFDCGTGTPVRPTAFTQSSRVTLTEPGFVQLDGATASTVSFFPRGSATRGSVKVKRAGADKTYTISVEGLTGRVSLAG